jgi:hypothetical protein
LHTGQTWGGCISTTVFPQLLHFQVFSGMVVLFSGISIPPFYMERKFNIKSSFYAKYFLSDE